MPICDACWAEFSTGGDAVCSRCGDSIDALPLQAVPVDVALCRACRLAPPPFVKAVSFGPYEGRMREAIHALKYDRLHPAARPLGRMLASAIARLAGAAPAEMLVVPIPLHKSKYAQRGFNQARSLAAIALKHLAKSHPQWRLALAPDTLMRQRATESQAGLTPHLRRVNVRGAFVVSDAAAVRARHILLVDDILTTGATVRAASRALLRAGVESVWVATLARARRNEAPVRGASFEDSEDLAGTAPATYMQSSGRFSSQDQPSF